MSRNLSGSFIDKYEKLYEQNPRSRVFAPLAENYRKLGLLDKAITILKQGVRYNPDYALGYLGLAACYFDLKKYEQSYALLRPLVSQNRDNLRLQNLFAETCLNLSYHDEALETYKYLLYVHPKDELIAKKVKELEDKGDKSNVVHIPSPDTAPSNFKMQDLSIKKPEEEVDSDSDLAAWQCIDLKKTKPIVESKTVQSEVQSQPLQPQIRNSDKAPITLAKKNETLDDEIFDSIDKQVVTHTLVDLYCSQGLVEKAVKVLEKIKELNPEDKKTLERLQSLKNASSEEKTEKPQTVLVQPQLISKTLAPVQKMPSPNNNNVISKLNSFCNALRAHAHSKNSNF